MIWRRLRLALARTRTRAKPGRASSRRASSEAVEARVLYSADPFGLSGEGLNAAEVRLLQPFEYEPVQPAPATTAEADQRLELVGDKAAPSGRDLSGAQVNASGSALSTRAAGSDGAIDFSTNPLETSAAAETPTEATRADSLPAREIVFLDAAVPDADKLMDQLLLSRGGAGNVLVVEIGADDDGLAVISRALSSERDVTAVHIISHGQAGALQLGNTRVDADTLLQRQDEVSGWRAALSADADLLLWGCDVGAGDTGAAFVDELAALTDADVAASVDPTGSQSLGGDWDLEYHVGAVATPHSVDSNALDQLSVPLAITERTTSSADTTNAGASSLTWAHTIASGSNGILIVEIASKARTTTVTSVTYGGVALTFLGASQYSGGDDTRAEMWYLKAPTTGTANIVVTTSGSSAFAAGATNFYGVNQTSPTGSVAAASANNSTPNVVVSSATGELVIDVLAARSTADGTGSVGAAQTQLFQRSTGGGGSDQYASASSEAGAASVTMSWTLGSNNEHAIVAVALIPAINAAPVLDSTKSPVLTAVDEDASAPVGAVGTPVSALVDFASPAGQVDNVTDADSGAALGIAVTAADTGNGSWWYTTDGGTNWNALGAVSSSSARLLTADANTRLHFQPHANYDGTIINAFTFRAWDQTTGSNGATADSSTNGASTAFSSATDTASLTVIAVNDAPVNTVPGAQTTSQNTTLVFSAANGNAISIADLDAGINPVAVTLTPSSGTVTLAGTAGLSFSAGDGSADATMSFTGTVANINAALDGMGYAPTAGDTGSATLQIVTNDQGNSGSGGALADTEVVPISVTSASLWISSAGASATSSPGTGGVTWTNGEAVNFGDPNLTLGPGTTSGTFSSVFDLDSFASSNANLSGLHVVKSTVTVGSTNPVTLQAGDVLLSLDANETLGGVSVSKSDIVLFRPTTPGNYANGTFSLLIRDPGGTGKILYDFALVEQPLTVGGTNLQAGDFLLAIGGATYDNDVWHFRPTTMSTNPTGGSLTELINGASAGINWGGSTRVHGLELVNATMVIGGQTLNAGTILVSLSDAGSAGSNGLAVDTGDVVALDVSATGAGSSAVASMLLRSADVGLTTSAEWFDAIALVSSASQAPAVGLPGGALNVTENDAATVIDAAATVTDADSADVNGGVLVVDFTVNGTADDRLAIRNQGSGAGQIGVAGSNVSYGGVTIGAFTGGSDGSTPLVVSFNSAATPAAVQALVRNITYANVSDAPATAARTVRFVVTDGDGGTSSAATKTINVSTVNDAPEIANLAGDDLAYIAGSAAIVVEQGGNALVTDVDSADFGTGTLTASFAAGSDNTEDVLAVRDEGMAGGQIGVSGNDIAYGGVKIGSQAGGSAGAPLVITLNASATPAAATALLRNITYQNTDPGSPTLGARTVRFVFTDGDGGTSVAYDTTVTVYVGNDAPVLDASRSPALDAVNEDAGAPAGAVGTLVSALVDFAAPAGQVDNVSDPDAGALLGIAVTAADTTNGTWWFSTDNGSTWNAMGVVGEGSARLLSADATTRVHFQPNANWNGTLANALTFRAWDRTAGSNGGMADLSATSPTVLDSFDVAAYSNNNGTANWTANWTETDDDGLAASGDLRIDSGVLHLDDYGSTGTGGGSVQRAFNLSGATSATLTFDYAGSGSGGLDTVAFEISSNGGTSWTALESMGVVGTLSGSKSYTLESHTSLTANMMVRIRIVQGFGASPYDFSVDNVQVAYSTPGTGGGSAFSSNADTASLTVNAVNDAPSATTTGSSLNVSENAPPAAVDAGLTLADVDNAMLASATVRFSVAYVGGQDFLAFTDQLGITGSWSAGTGTLTLSGVASVADYQAALRSVSYENTSEDPNIAVRTVEFIVNDGGLASAPATRQVQVVSVNDAPTTSDASATGAEDAASIAITLTSGDVDGTVGSLRLSSLPANGALYTDAGLSTLAVTGVDYAASGQSLALYFVPAADWTGVTTFQFAARDAQGTLDATPATATITVTAVNDAPLLVTNSPLSVPEEGSRTITPAYLQVTDVDDPATQIVYTVTQTPGSGSSLRLSGVTLGLGGGFTQDDINNNRVSFRFSDESFATSFKFAVSDGVVTLAEATFSINGQPVNDAPVNTLPPSFVVAEDTPTLLGGVNIADIDAASGLVTSRLQVSAGALNVTLSGATTISAGSNGSADLTLSGTIAHINATLASLTYTGAADAYGVAAATLSVTTDDGGNAGTGGALQDIDSATIDISPVNDAPTATNLSAAETFTEDTLLDLTDIVVSDIDSNNVTVTLTLSMPAAGTLSTGTSGAVTSTYDAGTGVWSASGALADINALLAGLSFAPSADVNGSLTIATSVSDGNAAPLAGTKNMTGVAVNDAPVLANAIADQSATEDLAFSYTLPAFTFNDVDAGDTLAYSASGMPAWLTFDAGNRTFSGTPANADVGSVTITLRATDAAGVWVEDPFVLSIANTNDAPTAVAIDLGTINEDGSRLITQADLLAGAGDADGDPLTALNLTLTAGSGSLTDHGDGTWTFTPSADWHGAVALDFDVTDGIAVVANVATLAVAPVNDAPVLINAAAWAFNPITEDQVGNGGQTVASMLASAGSAAITDADPGAVQGIAVNFTDPGNGSWQFSIDGGTQWQAVAAVSDGAALLLRSGDLIRFVPNGLQPTSASLDFRAWDRTSGMAGDRVNVGVAGGSSAFSSASAQAELSVSPVNDAPASSAVVLAPMAEDSGTRFITQAELLALAQDVDDDALQAVNLRISGGAGGLMDHGNGSWTYRAPLNFNGPVLFSYEVSDGTQLVAGSARLDVTPVNDPPVGVPVALAGIAEDSAPRLITQAGLLSQASDVDGDALAASDLRISSGAGTLVDNGNGSWSYTPAPDNHGTVSFSYRIEDGQLGIDTRASLAIAAINDAPRLQVAGQTGTVSLDTDENRTAAIRATASDVDHATQSLRFSLAGGADTALFALEPNTGELRFIQAPDFEQPGDANADGLYEVVLRVEDPAGGHDELALRVRVGDINDAPVLDMPASIQFNAQPQPDQVVATAAGSDQDAGDQLQFELLDDAGGRFVIDAQSGDIRYTGAAAADQAGGTHMLVVQVTDSQGSRQARTLAVVVPGRVSLGETQPMLPAVRGSQPSEDIEPKTQPDGSTDTPIQPQAPIWVAAELTSDADAQQARERLAALLRELLSADAEVLPQHKDAAARGNNDTVAAAMAATEAPAGASVLDAVAALVNADGDGQALRVVELLGRQWGSGRRSSEDGSEHEEDALASRSRKGATETVDELLLQFTKAEHVAGVGVSVGLVWWLTRGGGLLASAMMGTPAWKQVDLLAVISTDNDEQAEDDLDDEPEELQELFGKQGQGSPAC